MGVRCRATELMRKHGEIAASGDRRLSRWRDLYDEIVRVYTDGLDAFTTARKRTKSVQRASIDQTADVEPDADEIFVALQELSALRAAVKARIDELVAQRN